MTHPASSEPALRYDREQITQRYRQRPLQVWRRWLAILLPCGTFALQHWWDRKIGKMGQPSRRRAVQLRQLLTRLGTAYIKIGQALSTRPDLLPSAYLEELSKLQDELPPFPNEIAFQFIQEELGDTPDRVFAELTPDPVAAASLGQVYRGRLRTGETVAVKVQRPDLIEKIALDLYVLRQAASWAQRRFSHLKTDLLAILDEFGDRLYEEMDYLQEGQNAERFAQLYGHLPLIHVPKIYWNYTNRRVLTMEWITGTKLTHSQEIQAQGIETQSVIEAAIQCTLRQLLEQGFFHADPHPGNLLVMPSGELAYLDFGMMSEIQPAQRYGLINAVVHIVNRDFEALVDDYVQLDFLKPDVKRAPFVAALAIVFAEAGTATVGEFNFQVIMQQLSDLMYELPFRVPAYYALIMRSLVAIEGIAIGIDPNFKVLTSAYPYIAQRLLTDPAPELHQSLSQLLFKDGDLRWSRLEKLLTNARRTPDYDSTLALSQSLDFLFSERGEWLRLRLADELVKSLDSVSGQILEQATPLFRLLRGAPALSSSPSDRQMLDTLMRILSELPHSPGFNAREWLTPIASLLGKPEFYQTGRYILTQLAQKAIDRFTAQFLPSSQP